VITDYKYLILCTYFAGDITLKNVVLKDNALVSVECLLLVTSICGNSITVFSIVLWLAC